MTEAESDALDQILDRSATVPRHVIFREFAQETVALDIESRQYFLGEYPGAADVLARDLCRLCVTLSKRGLLDLAAV